VGGVIAVFIWVDYSLQPYEGLDPVDFCYSYENRYEEKQAYCLPPLPTLPYPCQQ